MKSSFRHRALDLRTEAFPVELYAVVVFLHIEPDHAHALLVRR